MLTVEHYLRYLLCFNQPIKKYIFILLEQLACQAVRAYYRCCGTICIFIYILLQTLCMTYILFTAGAYPQMYNSRVIQDCDIFTDHTFRKIAAIRRFDLFDSRIEHFGHYITPKPRQSRLLLLGRLYRYRLGIYRVQRVIYWPVYLNKSRSLDFANSLREYYLICFNVHQVKFYRKHVIVMNNI